MVKPKILVLSGYGINCEEETAYAFSISQGKSEIIHINNLIENPSLLNKFQILAIPGGFSFGDDIGSGKAFALKIKNNILDELTKFTQRDTLTIGICNGFQILTHLGLVNDNDNYHEPKVSLVANKFPRYIDRWVDLKITSDSPWLKNISTISLPIAHGEGKFFTDIETLKTLESQKQIAATYTKGNICQEYYLEPNPNGSQENIAAITDKSGKILGLMPHPERAIFFTQLPDWPIKKQKLVQEGKPLPKFGPGIELFKNSINYFT